MLKFIAAVMLLASAAWAVDKHDYTAHEGTQPVALYGGDTVSTYAVSVTSTSVATLRSAVTDRSRRKVCFQNTGNFTLYITSATTLPVGSTVGWLIGESTNTTVSPTYCTNSSAAFGAYLQAMPGNTGSALQTKTVNVLEETQSVP